jgi:hypothetical protein
MLPDRPRDHRLTAAERIRLETLEQRLTEDDPALAEMLSHGRPPRYPLPRRGWIAGTVAAACVLVLLAALVGGAGGAAATVVTLLAALATFGLVQHGRGAGPGPAPR